MNELIVHQDNLPDNIQKLSEFVLVGREKLVSVRAEIRAIDKLNLAQEVRDQKKEECSMLSEALLDAEVKLGDLLKQIPRKQGARNDLTLSQQCVEVKQVTSQQYENTITKTKNEVIKDLGFSKDQANRFETLANNKDLVEQVKQEAKENDDIPTRSRVLELAKARKQKEQEKHIFEITDFKNLSNEQFNNCMKLCKKYQDAIHKVSMLDGSLESFMAWDCILESQEEVDLELESVNYAIQNLIKIQNYFKGVKKNAKSNFD